MKVRNLGLIAALMFASVSCGQTPKPVEYNAGMCSPKSVGVYHVVMDGKKMSFDYYVDTDESVVKDDKPLVLDYTVGESLKETDALPVDGSAEIEGHKIQLKGMTRKDRIAALVFVDGHLSYVYYGVVGSVDELIKVKDVAIATCGSLVESDSDLPKFLTDFLYAGEKSDKGDKTPKAVEH